MHSEHLSGTLERHDVITEPVGARQVADGIESHPVYDFAPPAPFFATGTPPAGPRVFDARDYGAVADANINNQPMIQAAIEAAHAAGGGMVRPETEQTAEPGTKV